MLMRFQKKNLIDGGDSTIDSDDNDMNTLKLMESKNPFVRFNIYVKLKKLISSYQGKKLSEMDKNLIKGIYKAKLKDFDED